MAHHARKRFGQNFLQDQLILQRMVGAIAPSPNDTIVEIGPGRGALTKPLLQLAGKLTAIELDRDLIELLQKQMQVYGELNLIQADALTIDFSDIGNANQRLRIVGNLPYNISTPILFHLAAHTQCITDIHVLLQKEVADRIQAAPGNKRYGKLSVMMQLYFTGETLFDVPPEAFQPIPKVDSSYLRLTPHQAPVVSIHNQEDFNRIVSAAFSQRRKTLRNSLQTLLTPTQIEQANIDSGRRAETLNLAEFAVLANMLESAAEPHS